MEGKQRGKWLDGILREALWEVQQRTSRERPREILTDYFTPWATDRQCQEGRERLTAEGVPSQQSIRSHPENPSQEETWVGTAC